MLTAGKRVDRFELVAKLGEGGQGSVWRAVDLIDGSDRALKLVPLSEIAESTLERARREARLLSGLTHPGLVRCFGLFESFEQNVLGLVLELVNGETLEHAMEGSRLDRRCREAVVAQLIDSLAYLHERGLVHRDLKPSNVMLTDDFWQSPGGPGAVRLVDFGIAVAEHDPKRLTRTGHFIGTVPYLPPETMDPQEFPGSALSPSVDVFALGVLGSVLLQGGHPTGLRMDATVIEFLRVYRQGLLPPFSGDRLGAAMRASCEPLASRRPSSAIDVRRMLQSDPISTLQRGPLGASTEPTPMPVVATEIARPTSQPHPPGRMHAALEATPRAARPRGARLHWIWLIAPAVLVLLVLLVGVSLVAAEAFRPRPLPAPTPTPPATRAPTTAPPAPPPKAELPPCCEVRNPNAGCVSKVTQDPSCNTNLTGSFRLRLAGITASATPLSTSHPGATVVLQRSGSSTTVSVPVSDILGCGRPTSLRIDADDIQRGIIVVVKERGRTLFRGVARHDFVRNTALCIGLVFRASHISPSTSVLNVDGLSFFLDPV